MKPESKLAYEVCRLRGSSRERGRAYGEWSGDRLRQFLEKELCPLLDEHGIEEKERNEFADACMPFLVDHAPRTWAFLRGVNDTTEIRMRELTILMAQDDLLWSRGPGHRATCFAVGPRETSDGETYVGQTWDWFWRVLPQRHLVHQTTAEKTRILTYALPGLWSCAGMNSNGVSLVWTPGGDDLTTKPSRPRPGVPTGAVIAEVLEQASFDAALQCAMQIAHAGWFQLLLAARNGRLARIQASPEAKVCERPPSMACAHTPFTADGVRAAVGQQDAGQIVSYYPKHARLCQLLMSYSGRMDREILTSFLRDHVDEPRTASICCHPDGAAPSFAWGTLDGLIFSPSLNQVWFIPGPPCRNQAQALRYKQPGERER